MVSDIPNLCEPILEHIQPEMSNSMANAANDFFVICTVHSYDHGWIGHRVYRAFARCTVAAATAF